MRAPSRDPPALLRKASGVEERGRAVVEGFFDRAARLSAGLLGPLRERDARLGQELLGNLLHHAPFLGGEIGPGVGEEVENDKLLHGHVADAAGPRTSPESPLGSRRRPIRRS
jgi:hypothetical protein